MSRKANPTSVGLFVVIGTALLIAGIVSFSSFQFKKGTVEEIVLYFDSSVKGLSIGAPVTHRGCKIGTVKHMQLRFNQAEDDFTVPVFIEIDHTLIQSKTDRDFDMNDSVLDDLIALGLRGKLEASSFVTGQLYIELSLLPDAPPAVYHQIEPIYKEIPTTSTNIETLMNNLASVDIVGVAKRLSNVLEVLEIKIEDVQAEAISENLNQVLESIDATLSNPSLTEAIATSAEMLEDFKETSKALRGEVVVVSKDIQTSLGQIELAVDELREGVADVRHIISADNILASDLSNALEKLATASGSISELADFILLNPNALISGREADESK
jgi:paraquat-inducible protein B